jgi:preprotein translocase subunit SecE
VSLPEEYALYFPPLSRFFWYQGVENAMIKKLIKFLREVKLELKKVSWPSRKEISGSTGVVIVNVLIVAVYLGILDNLLQQIMMLLH